MGLLFRDFQPGQGEVYLILVLGVFVTDLFVDKRIINNVFNKELKFYISSLVVLFFAILFLSFNRMNSFNSFSLIEDAMTQTVLFKDNNSRLLNDGSITSNEDISFCIDHYLDDPRYFYGVLAQIVNPIPRIFWSDKPPGFCRILAHEAHGSPMEGSQALGWAAGIPGESMFNFGYFGLFLFPFLFGLLFREVDKTIKQGISLVKITTALMLLSGTYALIRGDWLWGFNYPIYNSLFAFGILEAIRIWYRISFKKSAI